MCTLTHNQAQKGIEKNPALGWTQSSCGVTPPPTPEKKALKKAFFGKQKAAGWRKSCSSHHRIPPIPRRLGGILPRLQKKGMEALKGLKLERKKTGIHL